MDRRTRIQRIEQLDETLEYSNKQLDRAVTAKSQIRLVLEAFRDKLPTEIFPGRTTVPKTLIFCKDDAHAEEVVTILREVFGKGNKFAEKITYTANTNQIGYARVSRADQDPQLQIDALKRAGCAKIFVDHMSGSHMDRPQLTAALGTCVVATPWFCGRWTEPRAQHPWRAGTGRGSDQTGRRAEVDHGGDRHQRPHGKGHPDCDACLRDFGT